MILNLIKILNFDLNSFDRIDRKTCELPSRMLGIVALPRSIDVICLEKAYMLTTARRTPSTRCSEMWTCVVFGMRASFGLLIVRFNFRKRLRLEFSQQYPDVSDQHLAELFGTKDEMTVMKICTHCGKDIVVYTMYKNPILFNVDDVLYPTGSYHSLYLIIIIEN